MAGINRLGKGPAKPGTMRPADPNKYKTMDIFSEGTEGDKDYARMVQDIEDTQQNHSGWLFGRGAFDKGDLLYLRDEEEKRRFAEQELRESELRSFARMRQKTEALQDDGNAGTDPAAEKGKNSRSQAEIVKSLLRVKAAPKVKIKQDAELEPATKRVKMDPAAAVKAETHIKEEEDSVKEEEDGGLGGLLGGYDSDEEDESVKMSNGRTAIKSEPNPLPLPLPESLVKREATVEAPSQVKQEPAPLRKGKKDNTPASSSSEESSE